MKLNLIFELTTGQNWPKETRGLIKGQAEKAGYNLKFNVFDLQA